MNPTPAIALVLVYAPGLRRPYALDPADNYTVCDNDGCESILNFVLRAIDAHPKTREGARGWTVAQVSFCDPRWPTWRVQPVKPEMRVLA